MLQKAAGMLLKYPWIPEYRSSEPGSASKQDQCHECRKSRHKDACLYFITPTFPATLVNVIAGPRIYRLHDPSLMRDNGIVEARPLLQVARVRGVRAVAEVRRHEAGAEVHKVDRLPRRLLARHERPDVAVDAVEGRGPARVGLRVEAADEDDGEGHLGEDAVDEVSHAEVRGCGAEVAEDVVGAGLDEDDVWLSGKHRRICLLGDLWHRTSAYDRRVLLSSATTHD